MSRGGKSTDKDTPDPGVYHIRDFIEEAQLNPVKKTYGFKSVGRKAETPGAQWGHALLPGAYWFPESADLKPSFFFKTCPRQDITLGVRDKTINTSPCDYSRMSRPVEKLPCKHAAFQSKVRRLTFPPKDGPAPCSYDLAPGPARGVTSCFRSTLPRLDFVRSTCPGPGAYQPYRPCWRPGDRLCTQVLDRSFSLLFRNSS